MMRVSAPDLYILQASIHATTTTERADRSKDTGDDRRQDDALQKSLASQQSLAPKLSLYGALAQPANFTDFEAEGGRRRGGVKDGQSASRLPPGLREHVLAAKRQQRPKGLKSVVAEATRAADPSAVDLEAGSTGMEPSSRKAQQPSQQQRANI